MEIKINYLAELEANISGKLDFIQSEFDYLFSHKMKFSAEDRKKAAGLINYLAKIVDSPIAVNRLSEILEELEAKYPNLF